VDLKYTEKDRARFWSKITKTDKCWIWNASTNAKGYGTFKVAGTLHLAHRVAWEMENGPIPSDMDVLHSCDNRPCCNPYDCLFLGTHQDNMDDRERKNRGYMKKGEMHPRHKLTDAQVEDIRSSPLSHAELSRQINISAQYISRIRNYKRR
jgi:hypothetical protein